ncbi:hypothetical protein Poli38472_006035 [Pythium oligandrum]|uniref:t-SNARE coiled-coil homology domain-containing protein n=1 Tax=Pythium oligandrum TaxID=41045 RepID=A0A8K1FR32_PYTOL|nr:hypothetical protein Poli38472_006035 [Pythium oligandrum]|eukprot:TMW68567.1 hypothetical protein Poli38472_006035 [Pythium oligandrum]
MDRTSDFVKITVLFDTGGSKVHTHRPLSQDARRAQQIADQLRQQELFLRDLQELVGKKSIIGDDPTTQIATLTDLLKKELTAIDKNIQMFQQAVVMQRGRHQQHHQAHFTIISQSLKMRCAKNVKQFHQALQQHTATIRERSSRRSKFSHGGSTPMVQLNAPLFARTPSVPPPAGNNPFMRPNNDPARAPLLNPNGEANSGPPQMPYPGAGPSQPAVGVGLRRRAGNIGSSPFMQQQKPPMGGPGGGGGGQQVMQYYPRQDAKTRRQNAAQVESTIVEITGMYTQMATMVAEQGEIISRIDDDMNIAQANTEAAHGELLKLYSMVSGNRALILKLFLVLLLVIFLFVVVF